MQFYLLISVHMTMTIRFKILKLKKFQFKKFQLQKISLKPLTSQHIHITSGHVHM